MDSQQHRKGLTEAAMIATLSVIFVLVIFYLPVLSLLLGLVPVPFLVLAVRRGTRYAFFSLIMTSLVIGMLTGVLYGFFVLVLFAPMSLAMGWWIRHRKEPHEVIFIGGASAALAVFVLLQGLAVISGINLVDEMGVMFAEVIHQQAEALQGMNFQMAALEEMIRYLLMVMPALIMMQALFGSFINYYLAMAVIRRLMPSDEPLPEFSRFRLPGHVVSGSFLLLALSWMTRFVDRVDHASLLANVTLLIMVVFFMQGISLMSFWIKGTRVPRWLRIVILMALVLISPMITLIAFLGILDVLADFRKLRTDK